MKTNQKKIQEIFSELKKVIVGQDYMVNRLLLGLFTQGHILLEGVPGLAKTLTVKTTTPVWRNELFLQKKNNIGKNKNKTKKK